MYIEYLDSADNFKTKKVEFSTYGAAITWGMKNLDNFNPDMIKLKKP
jgi:hypothetical protein